MELSLKQQTYKFVVHGNAMISSITAPDLFWPARFGVAHIRRFLSCPNFGRCVREPSKKYLKLGYWKYGPKYWEAYYAEIVKELQAHPCYGSACSEMPRPEFSSPCRRE